MKTLTTILTGILLVTNLVVSAQTTTPTNIGITPGKMSAGINFSFQDSVMNTNTPRVLVKTSTSYNSTYDVIQNSRDSRYPYMYSLAFNNLNQMGIYYLPMGTDVNVHFVIQRGTLKTSNRDSFSLSFQYYQALYLMAQKFKYIYIKDLGDNSISYIQNDMVKIAPATSNAQKASIWTMNPVFYTTANVNDLHNFEFHATNTNPLTVTALHDPSLLNSLNANCFIFNDQLNITLDDLEQINQLNVYNMSGQKILSQLNISNKAIIDMSEFPKGFYIVEVWNNQTVLRKKILY
jgi:hypothetical protein